MWHEPEKREANIHEISNDLLCNKEVLPLKRSAGLF